MDMVCVCGARLPLSSRFSICDSCMNRADDYPYDLYDDCPDDYYEDDPFELEDQFLDGMGEE